jgi:general nucleoside transport system permease protein
MLRLEVRAQPSAVMSWLSPVLALALTTLVATALFVALGKDPLQGLKLFFWEPIKSGYALGELALKATPIILVSLGLALCFRANIWNIGAEGQLLLGAIFGGGVALWVTANGIDVNRWAFVPVTIFAGALGGMLWASITALLRERFNANEILVSLMLVYVAQLLLSYLVFGPWKDPMGFNFPQTRSFDANTLLPRLVQGSRVHVGFVLAIAAAIGMWLFMQRTFAGFQLQVGGLAPAAARYAGFSARRAIWQAMLISGALAGMAGAMEATGPLGQLTPHVSTGYGFTAIIVAFLGRLHPAGCVMGASLLSMFLIGGELSQTRLALPAALTLVFQGLLLFSLLACDTLIHYRVVLRRKLQGGAA